LAVTAAARRALLSVRPELGRCVCDGTQQPGVESQTPPTVHCLYIADGRHVRL